MPPLPEIYADVSAENLGAEVQRLFQGRPWIVVIVTKQRNGKFTITTHPSASAEDITKEPVVIGRDRAGDDEPH